MATLRKWQPAPRRPAKKMISPDRYLVIGGCCAFVLALFLVAGPGTRTSPGPVDSAHIARERASIAAAQKAEAEQRARLQARMREEQRQEQARIFNQRYNTDRMPTGSVAAGESVDTSPPKLGFKVVKPALPPEQTGGGFREVKMGKQPAQ